MPALAAEESFRQDDNLTALLQKLRLEMDGQEICERDKQRYNYQPQLESTVATSK